MTVQVPKYYDPQNKIMYEADSCEPLRQAMNSGEIELSSLARGTYPGRLLQKDEIPGIKSIGFWNIKKLQDWGLEWHTNEGIEICFLESGNLDFSIKKQTHNLKTNDITITRPWIIHKLGAPNVGLSKLHWLILDVNVRHPHQEWQWPNWIVLNQKDLKELTRYLRQNEQSKWKSNSDIKNCFIQISMVIKQHKPYDSMLKIQINTLLILLLGLFRDGNITLDRSLTESKRTVELFLKSLESKLDDEWTVIQMAKYCHLGVTRLTHYCNEISNCSPMEYLNRLRLRKASKLLCEQPSLPVIDVAFMCGFSSSQYFNYAFKKHYKTSPNQYRKLNMPESKSN
jgi:AraC family L-rhamnose operon regulatory protein RhaS